MVGVVLWLQLRGVRRDATSNLTAISLKGGSGKKE